MYWWGHYIYIWPSKKLFFEIVILFDQIVSTIMLMFLRCFHITWKSKHYKNIDQWTFNRYTVIPRVTIVFGNPWKSKRKPNFCASELFLCTLPLLQRETSANALTLPILGSLLEQWPWLWQDPEGPDSRGTHEAVWMACARSIKAATQCFGTKDSWLTLTSPSLNYL